MTSHPVVVAHHEGLQARIADAITSAAGNMRFVYLHAVIFALWCATGLFGNDPFPFNFLTMAVSLEAIFLSTFVMIGQNRSASFAQAKADHDYEHQVKELARNTRLTESVRDLTAEVHAAVCGTQEGTP